jgi:hypothetical protein
LEWPTSRKGREKWGTHSLGGLDVRHPPDVGKPTENGQDPLNFRVSASFRREFKTYAAAHDLKLNELLVKCFESYRKQQAD